MLFKVHKSFKLLLLLPRISECLLAFALQLMKTTSHRPKWGSLPPNEVGMFA